MTSPRFDLHFDGGVRSRRLLLLSQGSAAHPRLARTPTSTAPRFDSSNASKSSPCMASTATTQTLSKVRRMIAGTRTFTQSNTLGSLSCGLHDAHVLAGSTAGASAVLCRDATSSTTRHSAGFFGTRGMEQGQSTGPPHAHSKPRTARRLLFVSRDFR